MFHYPLSFFLSMLSSLPLSLYLAPLLSPCMHLSSFSVSLIAISPLSHLSPLSRLFHSLFSILPSLLPLYLPPLSLSLCRYICLCLSFSFPSYVEPFDLLSLRLYHDIFPDQPPAEKHPPHPCRSPSARAPRHL